MGYLPLLTLFGLCSLVFVWFLALAGTLSMCVFGVCVNIRTLQLFRKNNHIEQGKLVGSTIQQTTDYELCRSAKFIIQAMMTHKYVGSVVVYFAGELR